MRIISLDAIFEINIEIKNEWKFWFWLTCKLHDARYLFYFIFILKLFNDLSFMFLLGYWLYSQKYIGGYVCILYDFKVTNNFFIIENTSIKISNSNHQYNYRAKLMWRYYLRSNNTSTFKKKQKNVELPLLLH